MTWELCQTKKLSRELLLGVLNGEIGAIQVPNFITSADCESAVRGIYAQGLDYYENVTPRIGRIGITQFEHRHNLAKKSLYFDKAIRANLTRQYIFRECGDLLERVIASVQEGWDGPCGTAVEDETQAVYFAGLVRVIGKALLHTDWAPLDAPEWLIGKISGQIAWNIYLQVGDSGGSTIVYNRPWVETDEERIIPGSYGYDPDLVKNAASVSISPKAGDLVLFNSRYFHEVQLTEGTTERITVSSFIGWLRERDELVFWS